MSIVDGVNRGGTMSGSRRLDARAGQTLGACVVKSFGEYTHDVELWTRDQ